MVHCLKIIDYTGASSSTGGILFDYKDRVLNREGCARRIIRIIETFANGLPRKETVREQASLRSVSEAREPWDIHYVTAKLPGPDRIES